MSSIPSAPSFIAFEDQNSIEEFWKLPIVCHYFKHIACSIQEWVMMEYENEHIKVCIKPECARIGVMSSPNIRDYDRVVNRACWNCSVLFTTNFPISPEYP